MRPVTIIACGYVAKQMSDCLADYKKLKRGMMKIKKIVADAEDDIAGFSAENLEEQGLQQRTADLTSLKKKVANMKKMTTLVG